MGNASGESRGRAATQAGPAHSLSAAGNLRRRQAAMAAHVEALRGREACSMQTRCDTPCRSPSPEYGSANPKRSTDG